MEFDIDLHQVEARYRSWMNQTIIRRFLQRQGKVFIATEKIPAYAIEKLLEMGHRHFSEKFVQEASQKWQGFRSRFEGITLHQYGHLQTNKLIKALDCYEGLESLDSLRLAEFISKRKQPHHRLQKFWIQINMGNEPQKTGVYLEEVSFLIHECQTRLQMPIKGLMAIPPKKLSPTPFFKELKAIATAHHLQDCIMGMTQDYEMAIEMGSTAIRIKRAVFGAPTSAVLQIANHEQLVLN